MKLKRPLLFGRKAMTNVDSILKSRDIILPTKVHIVKAMVFPVVMYGCDSWTIKKAERWRTDAFELWCWKSLLRVPWTARRSNQLILKEISPESSLEGPMLSWSSNTSATWCEQRTHWKGVSWDAGKNWRQKETGVTEDKMVGWHHRLNGHVFQQTLGDGGRQKGLVCYSPGVRKSQRRLSNWTTRSSLKKWADVMRTSWQVYRRLNFKGTSEGLAWPSNS